MATLFYEKLRQRFPKIAESIDDISQDLVHLEVADFGHATEQAIATGQTDAVREHLAFLEELFAIADPELDNALTVSYLEHVFLFSDQPELSAAVAPLLGSRSTKALAELKKHFAIIEASRKAGG
jgi:hypothetical protein